MEWKYEAIDKLRGYEARKNVFGNMKVQQMAP